MSNSVGSHLRRERESRSLSLEEVSNITRIPRKTLLSLEADRFEELPADVFVRGYIKAYASTVEVDPEELVARFDSTRPEAQGPAPLASVYPSRGVGGLVVGIATALVFAIIVTTFVLIRRAPAQTGPIELSSSAHCPTESAKPARSSYVRSTIATPTGSSPS